MTTAELTRHLIKSQNAELTEYHIYNRLAERVKNKHNKSVLQQIAEDEKRHSEFWEQYTSVKGSPNKIRIWWYCLLTRIFGLTFGIRLLEQGENNAQKNYDVILQDLPEAQKIMNEEDVHEQQLVELLKEKQLNYIGSIVLGLNDALVELTGALAGLTFALQNTHLIAIAGLITGIAASLSMAASEYLSNRADGNNDKAIASAIYTGIAYISTVALLVIPYFIFSHFLMCFFMTLSIAIFIIFVFNYYISVAKGFSFKKRFFEMAVISLGVAALSFGIGVLVRQTIGVDIG
ncbi:MAG: rubrerythrin family protein [Bacteroidetes bacterium]|jgi:VIT1/CCC1 family predicted Fe2+/Mn2+ transporter|nr:rubrerythrin family protein [Bacteroidota bacterium]